MSTFRLLGIAQHLASRGRASSVREEVLVAASQGRVVIDLTGVESVSDSFADELFGVLAEEQGETWFQGHLEVRGASDVVRSAIVRAIRSRLDPPGTPGRASDREGYTLDPPPEHLA